MTVPYADERFAATRVARTRCDPPWSPLSPTIAPGADPRMLAPDGITDRFAAVFGELRGTPSRDISPREGSALRHVIWQTDASAALLREETYAYACVALVALRAGASRDELWRERSAPGGVVFSGAFAALRTAGLHPMRANG